MLDYSVLKKIVETKVLGDIHLIPNTLIINTNEQNITVVGYKINKSTYFVNHAGNGNVITFNYSDVDILTAIRYLYQIYNNLTNTEGTFDNSWNPRVYRPDN